MKSGHKIQVLDHGYVIYIDHMGTDQSIVDAARISYQSSSKGDEADKKLLAYLWKNKHTSPFEMLKLKLCIKMPIFVARQYVRHRMQNMNEVSARYTQLPNEFYVPADWRKQDTKNKQGSIGVFNPNLVDEHGDEYSASDSLHQHCKSSYILYQQMLDVGVARELARMVLPLNIYTEVICCWDMKNLLHFIALRDDSHAQAEIQEYGRAIKSICQELFPWTMEAYERYKFQCVDTQAE